MKKILGLFLVFALLISACGGGGGGAAPTGASSASPTVTNNDAALAGKSYLRSWSVVYPSGYTVNCSTVLTYNSNGTFSENASDGGTRAGNYSLDSSGTLTETTTAGNSVETPVPNSGGKTVSCSDGDRYVGYSFKRLAVLDSVGNLTVRTLVLDFGGSRFRKIDSTTNNLEDDYVIWDQWGSIGSSTLDQHGVSTWSMKANGTWTVRGAYATVDGNWSDNGGSLSLTNIQCASQAASWWMDFVHYNSRTINYTLNSANYGTTTEGNQVVVTWVKQ